MGSHENLELDTCLINISDFPSKKMNADRIVSPETIIIHFSFSGGTVQRLLRFTKFEFSSLLK